MVHTELGLVDRLGELEAKVQTLERYIKQLSQRKASTDAGRAGTVLELVTEILSEREWATVSELAEAAVINERSVRAVLYTNKDVFQPHRMSPRRVRWRLARKTGGTELSSR